MTMAVLYFPQRTRVILRYSAGDSRFSNGKNRAEKDVLHDGVLGQHFGFVHFDETRIHFGPSGHGANVPQLIRMLSKWAVFDVKDEFDTT